MRARSGLARHPAGPLRPLWAGLAAALLAVMASGAAAQTTLKVTWIAPEDDPRLQRSRLERGALGHPGGPAVDALKIALAEAKPELEAAGARLELEVATVADAAQARAAAARAEKAGHVAIVTDLPADGTLAVADAVKIAVLNAGSTADALRQADCRRNLWHIAPSERMRADAIAQFLVARNWRNVLVLVGPADAERAATVQAAIRRYGLKATAVRPFKLSADPRERDLANPLLLTNAAGAGNYDAVWVVDADGEFAATLPYRTALPRPVVGDAGLAALAWSPRFDRYGAPQVTRRLTKAVGRPMGAHDWPAYMAGKAVVAAAQAAPKGPAAAFASALAGAEIDGSKGVSLNFRPWDGQLRQPMLLSDGFQVVAIAPGDGVLHPKNNLDTLGADAPEKLCRARL